MSQSERYNAQLRAEKRRRQALTGLGLAGVGSIAGAALLGKGASKLLAPKTRQWIQKVPLVQVDLNKGAKVSAQIQNVQGNRKWLRREQIGIPSAIVAGSVLGAIPGYAWRQSNYRDKNLYGNDVVRRDAKLTGIHRGLSKQKREADLNVHRRLSNYSLAMMGDFVCL